VPLKSTLSPLLAFEGDFSPLPLLLPLGEVELLQAATATMARQHSRACRFVTIRGLVIWVCESTSVEARGQGVFEGFGAKNRDYV
jgi:hypothetical protein